MSPAEKLVLAGTVLAVLGVLTISAFVVIGIWTGDNARWAGTGWAVGLGLLALAAGCVVAAVCVAPENGEEG